MIEDVLALLRCPVCQRELARGVRCAAGHAFDVARQGYLNLLTGRAPAGADTPAMVAARAEIFDAGHLAALTAAIVGHVPRRVDVAVDVGAGTGHHLAAVLDARPGSVGVALDVSKAAARRNARAHPALGSVVADVWGRLPLADACADVILDVFAPRNGPEFHRVLRPTGTLLVVTPLPAHLAELVAPLGLVTVDPDKRDRVQGRLGRWFEPTESDQVTYALSLTRAAAARFVAMGPSAWHLAPDELSDRLAALAEPITVTISIELTTWRPREATLPGPR